MGTITMIPAKRRIGSRVVQDEIPKTRVAAYCRVSTDTDEQATSYEAQVEHYTEYSPSAVLPVILLIALTTSESLRIRTSQFTLRRKE